MNWDKVKEWAGIIVATSAIILTVGGFLLNVWIKDAVKETVEDELAKLSFPSDETIATINGKNDTQDVRMDGFESRQDFSEAQMRDMAGIMMRRPE